MKKQRQLRIAGIFIAVVLIVVVAASWASRIASDISGPSNLVRDDRGRVWTQNGAILWGFDASGKVVYRRTAEELGVPNLFGPICPLSGGEMLVGSRDPSQIYWLDDHGRVKKVFDPGKTASGPLFNSYHMAFDESDSTLYVTDPSNHRVLAFGSDGRFLRGEGEGFSKPDLLRFPNQIRVYGDQVWIADTNHHELKILSRDLREIQRIPLPPGEKYTYRWPVEFDRDSSDNIYIIQGGERLRKGEVAKYDSEGRRVALIQANVDMEPRGVLVMNDGLLVSGGESFDIQRFSLDGHFLGVFGDSSFADEMHANYKHRSFLKLISGYAPLAILVLLALTYIGYLRAIRQDQHEQRSNPHELQQEAMGDPSDFARLYAGKPSVSTSVTASALLPGLGQILQRRFLVGVIFLTVAGILTLQTIAPLVTYLQKLAEIRLSTVYWAIVPLAALWLYNVWDAFAYARKSGGSEPLK